MKQEELVEIMRMSSGFERSLQSVFENGRLQSRRSYAGAGGRNVKNLHPYRALRIDCPVINQRRHGDAAAM